jgi:hypothetical protein
VRLGDVVRTSAGARAKLLFDDGTVLNLGDDTRLKVTRFLFDPAGDRVGFLELMRGAIRTWVTKLRTPKSRFEVQTPTAVAGVRGTDWAVREEDGTAQVVVFAGTVQVRSSDPGVVGECAASAGMVCEARRGEPLGAAVPASADLQQSLRDLTSVSSRLGREGARLASLTIARLRAQPALALDWSKVGGLLAREWPGAEKHRGPESRGLPGEGASLRDTILPGRLLQLRVLTRIGARY